MDIAEDQLVEKVCSICLAVGTEFYMFQEKFKCLLFSVCNKMSIEISEKSYTCCTCLHELLNLNDFKTYWVENEQKILLKVIDCGQKITMAELLYPDIAVHSGIPNICRLCFSFTDKNSMSELVTEVGNIGIGEMCQFALSDMHFELTYNPLFCQPCTIKIVGLYLFNQKCWDTENKIRVYLKNTGTTKRKINKAILLQNVVEHFQAGQDQIVRRESSFFKYFCEYCEYKSFRENALTYHKLVLHPVECILGSDTDTSQEACESREALAITLAKSMESEELSGDAEDITESPKPGTSRDTDESSLSNPQPGCSTSKDAITDNGSANSPTQFSCPDNPDLLKCNLCTKYSTFKISYLRKHLARHAKKLRENTCLICFYVAKSKVDLVKHNAQHFPTRVIKCPKCPYSADEGIKLYRHLARHQKKDSQKQAKNILACSKCRYLAKGKRELNRHMKLHKT